MTFQKNQIILPVFLVLFLTNFFELSILNVPGRKTFFSLITFSLFFFYLGKLKSSRYYWFIILYIAGVLGSCVYSAVVNHQQLLPTIGISYDYIGILLLGYFLAIKCSVQDFSKIIVYIGIIFCCCYIIQFFVYPIPLFHGAEEDVANVSESEGYRVRLPGSFSSFVLLFYCWQQYLLSKKKKYLGGAVLGFSPIIVMGFRSLTMLAVCSLILMVPFVLRNFGKSLKWCVVAVLLLLVSTQVPLVKEKLEVMEAKQENNQNFENKDYIRYAEFYYFYDYVFTEKNELIFGGGAPYKEETPYARMVHRDAQEDYGFFWADLGLVGLCFIIGIPAVVLLVFMTSLCIKKCSHPEVQFVRFALITVLIGSLFTTKEMYRAGNLMIIALLFAYEVRFNRVISKMLKNK